MHPKLSEIIHKAYRDLRPRAPLPEFHVRFFPFANVNNTIRLRDGTVYVRLSDLLEGAPESVIYAILHILLAKLYRKPIETCHNTRYRKYVSSHDVTVKTHLIRQQRGRKLIETHRGRYYDLHEIFESLNTRFFYGLLARPQMTWGLEARRVLGHYDPAHNTIVVSRVFDKAHVPRYAIEYLVYHEMLHLKHPVKLRGSKRCVHPPEFQAEERMFPHLELAKEFLKKI